MLQPPGSSGSPVDVEILSFIGDWCAAGGKKRRPQLFPALCGMDDEAEKEALLFLLLRVSHYFGLEVKTILLAKYCSL
jgi:hypothetical protein